MMNTLMRCGGIDRGSKNIKQLKLIYVWEKKINIYEKHDVCPDFYTITSGKIDTVNLKQ